MSDKPKSVFAGLRLTEQTSLAKPGPDQRLFAPSQPRQPAAVPPPAGNPPEHHESLQPRNPDEGESGTPAFRNSGFHEIPPPGIPEHRDSGFQEIPKSGKGERQVSRKPDSQKTRKPETMKREKYSTMLQPATVRQIKRYALDHDLKDYEVVQAALNEYFAKR